MSEIRIWKKVKEQKPEPGAYKVKKAGKEFYAILYDNTHYWSTPKDDIPIESSDSYVNLPPL